MQWFHNMKIRKKLLLGFLLVGLFVFVGYAALSSIDDIGRSAEQPIRTIPSRSFCSIESGQISTTSGSNCPISWW